MSVEDFQVQRGRLSFSEVTRFIVNYLITNSLACFGYSTKMAVVEPQNHYMELRTRKRKTPPLFDNIEEIEIKTDSSMERISFFLENHLLKELSKLVVLYVYGVDKPLKHVSCLPVATTSVPGFIYGRAIPSESSNCYMFTVTTPPQKYLGKVDLTNYPLELIKIKTNVSEVTPSSYYIYDQHLYELNDLRQLRIYLNCVDPQEKLACKDILLHGLDSAMRPRHLYVEEHHIAVGYDVKNKSYLDLYSIEHATHEIKDLVAHRNVLCADLLNRYPIESIKEPPEWRFASENKSEFYYIYVDSGAGVMNTAEAITAGEPEIIDDPCGKDHLCVFKKSERGSNWTPVRQWIPYDTSNIKSRSDKKKISSFCVHEDLIYMFYWEQVKIFSAFASHFSEVLQIVDLNGVFEKLLTKTCTLKISHRFTKVVKGNLYYLVTFGGDTINNVRMWIWKIGF